MAKRNKKINRTKGKITYRFETPAYPGNILYVNLIKRYSCTNNCLFCSRPRTKQDVGKENIYEKKAGSFLYLSRSPSVERVLEEVDKDIKPSDKEVAIIGLGEPLIELLKVIKVIKGIKDKYDIQVRIDTNGFARCKYNDPVQRLEDAGLDELRISLNAINEKEYNILCRPKFDNTFPNLINFVRNAANSNIETYVSFVARFDSKIAKSRTKQEYIDFATSLGVKPKNVIIRDYIKPTKS